MPLYITEHGRLLRIESSQGGPRLQVYSRKHKAWKDILLVSEASLSAKMGAFGEDKYRIMSPGYQPLHTINIPSESDKYGYFDCQNPKGSQGARICFMDITKLGINPEYLGVTEVGGIEEFMCDANLHIRAQAAKAVRQQVNQAQTQASVTRLEDTLANGSTEQVLEALLHVREAVVSEHADVEVKDRLSPKLEALIQLAERERKRLNTPLRWNGRAKAALIKTAIETLRIAADSIPESEREQSYVQLARESGLYKALKMHRFKQKEGSTKKTDAQIACENLVPEVSLKM